MVVSKPKFKFSLENSKAVILFTQDENKSIKSVRVSIGDIRKNENFKFCLNFYRGELVLGARLTNSENYIVPVNILAEFKATNEPLMNSNCLANILTEKEYYELILSEMNRLFDKNGNFLVYDVLRQRELEIKIKDKYDTIIFGNSPKKESLLAAIDFMFGRQEDIKQIYYNISSLLYELSNLNRIPFSDLIDISDESDFNSEKIHELIREEQEIIKQHLNSANSTTTLINMVVEESASADKRVITDDDVIKEISVDCKTEPVLVTDINQTVLFKAKNRFFEKFELANVMNEFFVTYMKEFNGFIIPVVKIDLEKYDFSSEDLEVFSFDLSEDYTFECLGVDKSSVVLFNSDRFKEVLKDLKSELLNNRRYTEVCANQLLRSVVYTTVKDEYGNAKEIVTDSNCLKTNLKTTYDMVISFLKGSNWKDLEERYIEGKYIIDEVSVSYIRSSFKNLDSKNLGLTSYNDLTNCK